MYKIYDEPLKNIPVALIEPSMSAEFFDRVGLIICGLNPNNNKTEVHIYSPIKNRWTLITQDDINFNSCYGYIGLKTFSFNGRDVYMVLMGGKNNQGMNNIVNLFKFDQENISF